MQQFFIKIINNKNNYKLILKNLKSRLQFALMKIINEKMFGIFKLK